MTFRRTRCPHCKGKLENGQRIHPDCVEPWADSQQAKAQRAEAKRVRAAAKVERAHIKARRRELETIPELIRAAQREFNAYIRERDKDKPCICCGRAATSVDGIKSHGWDAGHYRSTGSASHLRFNEANCHRQLVLCNRYGAGRAVDYRLGLIERIGLTAVEALEADNTPKKWTREELRSIRDAYKAKVRALKKEQE